MPAVRAAPSSAARTAAAHAARALPPADSSRSNASAAGTNASSIVRSPGFAPPSSPIASMPLRNALAQSRAPGSGASASRRAARTSAVA
ncbi:hypothetical protein DO72_5229 [Burkholderia pseudomallei]|nr:hypothetical protein DO72_5229 [Burkholderia pseudomallei]